MKSKDETILLQALAYSKSELQQAENKTNIMLTMNALLLTAGIGCLSILVSTSSCTLNGSGLGIFIVYPVLNLISITILATAYRARYKKLDSIGYFKSTINGVTDDHFINSIEMAKETISVNSGLCKKKYDAVNKSLFITFFPLSVIYLLISLPDKKENEDKEHKK